MPTTYRILGANVRRPAKAGENYKRTPADVEKMLRGLIAAGHYDALILLECSEYHAMLKALGKALGYDVLFWSDAGRGDNVILVRRDVSHDAGATIEHGPDAWWFTEGGGKSWGRGHVTVKLPGLRLVGVHTPPSVNWVKGVEVGPVNRIRTFVRMMTSLRAAVTGWATTEPDTALLVYGDWNEPPTSTGTDSPNDVAHDLGLTIFPGSSIDYSMGRGVVVKTRAIPVGTEGNTSDHPLLDITATVSAPVAPAPKPAPAPSVTTYGLDVSGHQNIDLAALVAQGYAFFASKCTEGATYADPTYAGNLAEARSKGGLFVAYHFVRSDSSAAAQADNIARHIVDKSVPVMLDCEPTGPSRPTLALCAAIRSELAARGIRATLLYFPNFYWSQCGKPDLKGWSLWQASYPSSNHAYGSALYAAAGGNAGRGWAPQGGVTPVLWQFASTGKVDGYSGPLDVDAFRGARADLAATGLFKDFATTPAPTPTPRPVPTPPAPIPEDTMRSAPEAIAAANRATINKVGTCQMFTHQLYDPSGALAVGDFDGDGDADAVDGWKSEGKNQRTDRRPAIGAPGAWGGGSKGYGHRAICIGYLNGEALFRSTDGNGPGRIGNHTLSWFEQTWGLHWLGWSPTISGHPIKGLVPAPGTKQPTPPAPSRQEPTLSNSLQFKKMLLDACAWAAKNVPAGRAYVHVVRKATETAAKAIR